MNHKLYALVSGVVFAFVALVHLWRVVAGWNLIIAGIDAPMWVSWIGLVVAGFLAFCGLRLGLEK